MRRNTSSPRRLVVLVAALVAASVPALLAAAPAAGLVPIGTTLASSEPIALLLLGAGLATTASVMRSVTAQRE
jgi:hypothetical protein